MGTVDEQPVVVEGDSFVVVGDSLVWQALRSFGLFDFQCGTNNELGY